MGFLLVLKAELVRGFIIMRRYWFRTLIGWVVGYGMLIGLAGAFVMNRDAVTTEMAHRFSDAAGSTNWALGFIIGMYAFGIVGMFTQELQGMAASGQLEQLCMSPHGLITNLFARTFVGCVTSVLTSAFMLWAVAKTLGGTLHADFVPTFSLLVLMFSNLIGFGFMMGGLVLVFKQVGQVAVILRMVLFALAVAASEELYSERHSAAVRWIAHAMPVTDGAVCLKYVLTQGQMRPVLDDAGKIMMDAAGAPVMRFESVFQHPSLYFLVGSCVFWTIVGLICFKLMENWSRRKGTLGAY